MTLEHPCNAHIENRDTTKHRQSASVLSATSTSVAACRHQVEQKPSNVFDSPVFRSAWLTLLGMSGRLSLKITFDLQQQACAENSTCSKLLCVFSANVRTREVVLWIKRDKLAQGTRSDCIVTPHCLLSFIQPFKSLRHKITDEFMTVDSSSSSRRADQSSDRHLSDAAFLRDR